MQILLIYEMVPERSQIYNLCISDEDAQKIIKCHNHYGNTVDQPEGVEHLTEEWLPKFLMDFTPVFDSDKTYKGTPQKPFTLAGFELEVTVVVTGFIL